MIPSTSGFPLALTKVMSLICLKAFSFKSYQPPLSLLDVAVPGRLRTILFDSWHVQVVHKNDTRTANPTWWSVHILSFVSFASIISCVVLALVCAEKPRRMTLKWFGSRSDFRSRVNVYRFTDTCWTHEQNVLLVMDSRFEHSGISHRINGRHDNFAE